ncbi:MAG: hypothetical protein IJV31_09295 [Clostridia bacterium]|nr:hypothetical protein [Clostridia bacterium]
MSVNIKQAPKKIIAGLLVIMLTITNFLLVAEEIAEAVSIDLNSTNVTETVLGNSENTKITISNNVEKFIKLRNEKGVLLQTALTIDVAADENATLSDGQILINVPKIDNKLPKSYSIIMDNVGFKAPESISETLTIVPTENVKHFSYKIVYIYDESVWNETNTEKTINWNTKYDVKVNGTQCTQENREEAIVSEMGDEVSLAVNFSDVYKGEIIEKAGQKVETQYNEEWKLEISALPQDGEKINYIGINSETPNFDISEAAEINSYFVKSKISINQLEKIVGSKDKSKLEISAFDAEGKETKVEVKDPVEGSTYLTAEYPENTVRIKVTLKDVTKNSIPLTIQHEKKIVSNLTSAQAETLNKMTENVKTTTEYATVVQSEVELESGRVLGPAVYAYPSTTSATMEIIEPQLTADFKVNGGNSLITAVENKTQNINFTYTLLSEDAKTQALFVNPEFNIQIPEGMNVAGDINVDIQPQTGTLKVESAKVENGKIVVKLSGTNGYVANGTNTQVSIDVPMNIDKTMPNKTVNIVGTYSAINSNKSITIEKEVSTPMQIKTSNEQIYAEMTVSVENTGTSTTYSDTNKNSELAIPTTANSKAAKVNVNVINNNDTKIENVEVVFNAVYTNKDGQKETLLSQTETVAVENNNKTNVEKVITLPEALTFNENIEITATTKYAGTNLEKTNTTVLKTETVQGLENAEAVDNKLLIGTVAKLGDGTELNANDSVFVGEVIEYTTTITNLTNEPINNLKLNVQQTNGNMYGTVEEERNNGPLYGTGNEKVTEHRYEEIKTNETGITVPTIDAKKAVSFTYTIVVKNGETTYGTMQVEATGIETKQIKTIANNIKEAKIKALLQSAIMEENTDVYATAVYPINLNVENLTTNDLNAKVRINLNNLEWKENSQVQIPENSGVKVSNINYNKEQNYVEFDITLPAEYKSGNDKNIQLTPYIKAMDATKTEGKIEASAKITNGNDVYTTNTIEKNVKQNTTQLKVEQTSNIKENQVLKNGDEVVIETTITNEGNIAADDVSILDTLIAGLEVKSVTVNGENKTDAYNNGLVSTSANIEPGKTAKVVITATVNTDNMASKQFTNKVTANDNGTIYTSNELKFNADVFTTSDSAQDPTNPENPIENGNTATPGENGNQGSQSGNGNEQNPNGTGSQGNNQAKTYSIEGTVWQDANEDGQIGNESKLSGITVKLIDVNNQNAFVKDANGNEISVTTDNNGNYKITNLPAGNYSAIFVYDTNKYEVANNSIAKDYMLGQSKVAITNTINLAEDKANINLGLIEIKDFDLKLDKYITKVTTQTSKETKSTTYENKQLARTEIASKQLSGASIIVEYTLRVTNSGELAGYVTKLQDNLPKDMKFSSELNKEWYMDADGNLYNTSLASTIINPGESKDVKLVLIKNMTTDNTGTTTNTAKIVTTSNAKGYNEINLSNNESKADLLVNPATGKVITYVLIVVNSIIIVLLGVYIIKRKIID